MSFWVGPRASTASRRPPAPGRSAPGSGAPPRSFPKQKAHTGSADDLPDTKNDGSGLFPTRRGRRGTVQGAPPAPLKAAPRAPPPGRRASRFSTPPQNVETRPMSASAYQRANPPPITKEMKKEVRRKSGLTVLEDLSDEEDEDKLPTEKRSKKLSSMFRSNTDTVWTDDDLEALHGDMREEFEKLTSNSQSNTRQSGLHKTTSMSLSRDQVTTPQVLDPRLDPIDSIDTLINDSPMVPLDSDETPDTTPRSFQGEAMLKTDTKGSGMLKVETAHKFISTDSDMTVYSSVDFDPDSPNARRSDAGSSSMGKKRSVRDGIEDAPLSQREKDGGSRRSSVAVESTVLTL